MSFFCAWPLLPKFETRWGMAASGLDAVSRLLRKFDTTPCQPVTVGLRSAKNRRSVGMRHRTPIEFYRDAASLYQLLADIEPWQKLREQYRQLAADYRAQAAALEAPQSGEPAAAQRAA